MDDKKIDFLFLFALVGSLFIFYPALFLAQAGALMGDHIEQHYPWAYLLHASIKNFQVPFWTPLMHSGFPLAAEGQIGVFYLPNLALNLLLPFHVAYSYANIVHFLISGIATYAYSKSIGLNRTSAFFSSFIFLFGSIYGGAYYNITSLKTLCWFPVCLFLFEQYLKRRKFYVLLLLTVCLSFSLLAGYLQIAILMFLVLGIYVMLRIFLFPVTNQRNKRQLTTFVLLNLAVAGAIIIALPQLILTYQLAVQSNRINLSESYAYVGSLSPFALSTIFFDEFQAIFRGNSLYLGVLPMFFILCSFKFKKHALFRLWVLIGGIALLLALGRWSPLYVALIKVTGFYSFRTPAKFIFFICFAGSILSGMGINALSTIPNLELKKKELRSVAQLFSILAFLAIVFHLGIIWFLSYARPIATAIGEWFVRHFIFGKAGHPHSLEVYDLKLQSSLNSISETISMTNPWNMATYGLLIVSALVILYLIRRPKKTSVWITFSFILIFIDLYLFAWRDIKLDFDYYKNAEKPNRVLTYLLTEKKNGEVGRIYGFHKPSESLALNPNQSILYGIEDIGAYSPLVLKRYHESIGLFGNVNDSNFTYETSADFVKERTELLNALGVTHILSSRFLDISEWEYVLYDTKTKTHVYKNKAAKKKFFFVSKLETFNSWEKLVDRFMAKNFDPSKILLIEEAELKHINGNIKKLRVTGLNKPVLKQIESDYNSEGWTVKTNQPGFFVVMNTAYSGWHAFVNGNEVPILKANGLFQTIFIEKPGTNEIKFIYRPSWLNRLKN